MKSTHMSTPATGLSCYVPAFIAPIAVAQGTGLSFAGTSVVPAAAEAAAALVPAGVRTTDLPGSPPRGAPV